MRLPSSCLVSLAAIGFTALNAQEPLSISGICPHLASFNAEGPSTLPHGECGIGAVVPWAGKLWWITYPPHFTKGSNDKLFSVAPDMQKLEIAPESVGGTHANRMIHHESNQLIIGPYFITSEGVVRACDVRSKLIGRMTGTARHLTDPENMVYIYDMEGMVYEVNVHTLDVKKLFEKAVPGWHGKGAYTSQGRFVISNNGEHAAGKLPKEHQYAATTPHSPENAGVLAEWDGKEWRIVERRQFTDVTGPGGIHGAPDDNSPLWAMGWDKRSVILKLLDGGEWSTFRLPKGSYSFDPKHGWYTEWPRIRKITNGQFLMVMHGQMFDFPKTFSLANTAGIRPVNTHIRYVPDFCAWGDKLVIASDDASLLANPLCGQSQSNLWFGKADELRTWGPVTASGAVWLNDAVKAGSASDPFLSAGYSNRVLHIAHKGKLPVTYTLEGDVDGKGAWKTLGTLEIPAMGYKHWLLPVEWKAEWVRLRADKDTEASAFFFLSNASPHVLANGDPTIDSAKSALVKPAKGNGNLQVQTATGFYEVDEKLSFTVKEPAADIAGIQKHWDIAVDAEVDNASVIVKDAKGQRWRLPKSSAAYDKPATPLRGLREIQSERWAANWHGTFYEIPRMGDEMPEIQRIKPLCTHRAPIVDFCNWRGLLVLSGGAEVPGAGKTFASVDGKVSLWFGKTDDLWRFGRAAGHGGPWRDASVKANTPSDPYLMAGYDKKTLTLSHKGGSPVKVTVEVDFAANGQWYTYDTFSVEAGKPLEHAFPAGYAAHWVRLKTDSDCEATAEFLYE